MQTITVDMTPGFRQPTIHYSQNDVGTTFAIDLRSRFGDTLPASPTVKIQATKPSGFGFSIEADSVVDSVATFTTVATMTDEAGRFLAELEVSDSGVVLYTANFYMEGEANPHPIGTTDGSQETIIPTLTLLVERVEAAAASVLDMEVNATTLAAGSQATYSYDEATNTATFGIPQGEAGAGAAGVTASAYSSSKTYAVGDYVIHNSNLYRCTTAITTAEAFTAAHWTQVVLGDDVCDLKSELNDGFEENNYVWQRGGLNADGITSQLYRLVTPNAISAVDTLVVINKNTSYLYEVWWTKDGTTSASGWIGANDGGFFKVPSGSTFRIVIRKATENYQNLNSAEVSEMSALIHIAKNLHQVYVDTVFNKEASMYGNGLFDATDFIIGIYYDTGSYYKDTARVCSKGSLSFTFDTYISVNTGYRMRVLLLDSEGHIDTFLDFRATDVFIPKNTAFKICIDNGSSSATANVTTYAAQISFRTPLGMRIKDIDSLEADNSTIKSTLGIDSKAFTWEQGGLDPHGETVDTSRIRMSSIEIMPDYVTVKPNSGYKALIYTYASNGDVVIAGSWQTSEFTTAKGTASYFRVVLAHSQNGAIATSESTNVVISYGYVDISAEVMDLAQKINKNVATNYFGLPVSAKQGYNAAPILTISYSGGTLNSIAVYGNYVVAIINGLHLIRIYDKTTKSLLYEIELDLGHANCVGLGSKYAESDLLPLLYVEKEDSYGTYNVVRVQSDASASIIKTYTFPEETFGHYPQVAWNFDDGLCYSLGADGANKTIFVRANLNDETLNDDGSYTPNVLFTCKSQKVNYIQDVKFFNNMIYMAHSTTTTDSAVSHVFMIDSSSGNIITKIPAPFTGEIEGMAVYKEDGEVKMCTTNYYTFYEMTFA